MTNSTTTPTEDDKRPVYVLVNFPLDPPERALIEGVDPRIKLESTMRPAAADAHAPGGGMPPAPGWDRLDDDAVKPLVERAEVMFGFRVPLEWLDIAKNLRWVQLSSAGADHFIRIGMFDKRPDLMVTTASGIHEVPISEQVLGYMLSFARGLMIGWRQQQTHTWNRYDPQELAGKTLGILGYGPIARRVALLAKAFEMRVLVTRRSPAEPDATVDRYYGDDGLHEMLPECDYLLLAAPSTPATRRVIGATELQLMKKSAVLLNISRGALIDEQAMISALRDGVIAGAALDVFEQEPLPADSPLWALPNVLITPHVAGSSPLYNRRASELFCANLRAYLSGAPLRNVVDPARGY